MGFEEQPLDLKPIEYGETNLDVWLGRYFTISGEFMAAVQKHFSGYRILSYEENRYTD
jgi:hypothetical protein